CWPAPVEPVKEMPCTRGSLTSTSPTSLPLPVTRLSTPPGRPASSKISTSLVAMIGVSEAGLNTTALPPITAGKIFHDGIAIGKFQGVMHATTPSGNRAVMHHMLTDYEDTDAPWAWRRRPAASSAMSV